MSLETQAPGHALVVMAHPDDAELGCFGTLLALRARGWSVSLLIVGSGEQGVSIEDRERGAAPLATSLRFEESQRAFEGTGVSLQSLLWPDGAIRCDRELIAQIEQRLRQLSPSLVITHFIDDSGVDHQDHGAVARATMNACARASSVRTLLMAQPQLSRTSYSPQVFIDVTPFHERKLQALSAHQSQAGRVYLSREYHEARAAMNAHRAGPWLLAQGRRFESFALAFQVVL